VKTLLAVLATLVRLVLPARGLHAAPRGTADLVQVDEARGRVPAPRTTRVQADEARERVPAPRTARVRRYVPLVPASWSPYGPPVPWTPIVQAENVNPQAELVRPYYVAYELAAANGRAEVAR